MRRLEMCLAFFLALAAQPALAGKGENPFASIDVMRWKEYSPEIRARKPPVYPPYAQRRGITGTTFVIYTYDETGKILSTNVARSSGSAYLDKASILAVRDWIVTPKQVDGHAVAGYGVVPIQFSR